MDVGLSFRMVRGALFALVLAAPAGLAAQDAADDAVEASVDRSRVAWNGNRLSLRFTSAPSAFGIRWDRNGRFQLVGTAPIVEVEASLTLENQMTFELMGQWLLAAEQFEEQGGAVTGRVGYSIPLHQNPNHRHRAGFLVPLVGYVYARRPGWQDIRGTDLINETHSVEAALAYDFFSGWRNAAALRVLVGAEYVLDSTLHHRWYVGSEHMRVGLRVSVLYGVSFRSLGEAGENQRARARPEIRTGGARLGMRFTSSPLSFEFSNRDFGIDHVDIGVIELSLTLPSNWTMELSMGLMYSRHGGRGLSGTGRIGYSVPIAENRSGSLSAFLVPLVGYRYARRPVQWAPRNDTHSAQLGAAVDLLVGRGSALSLRLFGAYEYAFVSEHFYYTVPREPEPKPMTYSIQYGLLVGFTFRGIGAGS